MTTTVGRVVHSLRDLPDEVRAVNGNGLDEPEEAAIRFYDRDIRAIVKVPDSYIGPIGTPTTPYEIVLWRHQRGEYWRITATSDRDYSGPVTEEELPDAIRKVLAQDRDRPLTPAESQALDGYPWIVRVVQRLFPRRDTW